MKYATEMTSGGMIYVSSLMKISLKGCSVGTIDGNMPLRWPQVA
jgi:hypothetical protein